MDRERFDALARLIASKRSRRGAIAAVLGLALMGPGREAFAESGKGRGKGHDKGRGKGHGASNGQGHACEDACAGRKCGIDPVTGKPEFCCKDGSCSCGGKCCGDACFQTGDVVTPNKVFCCTGSKKVICGETKADETCCEGSCEACDTPGPAGIAGSYRRPR